MSETVLITGARAMAALDIARAFKRIGYQVHLADSAGGVAARLSRHVDAVHRYAAPRADFSGFGEDMAVLAGKLSPRLIIPTCEEIFHLARLPKDHSARAVLFAPPIEVLRQLHDKASFASLCADLSLPVPQTHRLTSRDDIAAFRASSEEWVFKPCFSRFGTHTLVGPHGDALSQIMPSAADPWVAQARISGEEICFHAIAHAGTLSAFVAYRGTWRLNSGASLGFEALDVIASQPLFAIAQKLAAGLSLTGQFGCDLILDTAGQPWLIECNPRATSGVHLWAQEGALARAFLETDQLLLRPQDQGQRYLGPAMMTLALGDALRSGRFSKWHRVMLTGRDVVAIKGDRLPVLGALLDGLAFVAKGAFRGISATAATTLDIEWNGETHDQSPP